MTKKLSPQQITYEFEIQIKKHQELLDFFNKCGPAYEPARARTERDLDELNEELVAHLLKT